MTFLGYPLYHPYDLEELDEFIEFKRFEERRSREGLPDLYPFFVFSLANSLNSANKGLFFIYGPKGAGKTWSIFRIISDGKLKGGKVLYGRLSDFKDVEFDTKKFVEELRENLRGKTYLFLDDFLDASFVDELIYQAFNEGLFDRDVVLVLTGSKNPRVLEYMLSAMDINAQLQRKEPDVPLVFVGPRPFVTYVNAKGVSTLEGLDAKSGKTMFYKFMTLKFLATYAFRKYLSYQEFSFASQIAKRFMDSIYPRYKKDMVVEVLDNYVLLGGYPQAILGEEREAREYIKKTLYSLSEEELELLKTLMNNAFRPIKVEDEALLDRVAASSLMLLPRKIEPGEDPFDLLGEASRGREVLPVPIDPLVVEVLAEELGIPVPRSYYYRIPIVYHLFLNALFFVKLLRRHYSDLEFSMSTLPIFFGSYNGKTFFDQPLVIEPHRIELLIFPREKIDHTTDVDIEELALLGIKHATTPIVVPKDYMPITYDSSSSGMRFDYDFYDTYVEPSDEDLELLKRKRGRYNTYAREPKPHERSVAFVTLYDFLFILVPRKRSVRS